MPEELPVTRTVRLVRSKGITAGRIQSPDGDLLNATLRNLITPGKSPVRLSAVESFFWRSEELGRGYRVAVLVHLDGCIEAELLSEALGRLQRRHPKLRAAVVEGSDCALRYHFREPVPPIPHEIRDFDGPDMPWRQETHRLLAAPFPELGPYVAVTVLRSRSAERTALILAGSHAFVDGLSGIMLIDGLLAAYASAEGGDAAYDQTTLLLISPGNIRPRASWRQRVGVLRRFRAMKKVFQALPSTPLPEDPDTPPLSQWMHWTFSQADTVSIVRRCRRERVSLGSLLLAAVYCSVREATETSGTSFRWHSPFNVRNSLRGPHGPVQPGDLGCFMSSMNGFFRGDLRGGVWDVARCAQEDIDAFAGMAGPAFGYNLASFLESVTTVGRWLRLPAEWLMPHEHPVTLLATNYGVTPLRPAYGSLHLRGCTLMCRIDSAGTNLVAEALVLGQKLNVGFAASGLEACLWQRLQTSVRSYLTDAAGSAISDGPVLQRSRVAAHE